jgi:hypothetical protein
MFFMFYIFILYLTNFVYYIILLFKKVLRNKGFEKAWRNRALQLAENDLNLNQIELEIVVNLVVANSDRFIRKSHYQFFRFALSIH